MTRYYHSFILFLRSFSEYISTTFFLALSGGIMLFFSSCEEDPGITGRKILPGSDFVSISSTDTIKVESYTLYQKSVESDNPNVSYVGDLYDPYFGLTTTEFVTQLRLGSTWEKEYFFIDSIKLFLRLLSVKGDVEHPHYLKMSEISEQIYTDSTYYSDKTVPVTGFYWDSIPLPAMEADTINNVEINIPVSFGNHVTRDTSMLFHSTSGDDFRSYFKGIYFQMDSSEYPLQISLSVAAPSSYGIYNNYFVLYMRDASSQAKNFVFVLDAATKNAAFNKYIHKFERGVAGKRMQHLIDNDTNFLDTVSFVQTMYGAYTKIKLPGLEALKANPLMKNISINKARLIFPVYYDGSLYSPSTIPSSLYLRYSTKSGVKYIVPDYAISPAFYDGTPDTLSAVNVYNLNIPSYLQVYLEDTENSIKPELELFLTTASSNNVILKANNSHTPVKLELTYTKF